MIYLGAANLAGYLAGALVARGVAAKIPTVICLRVTMALAAVSCFACAAPVSFPWYFGWRFVAGLAGGFIMILGPSTILAHTAPARRGLVGGVIFAGVGLGVAASGTLVPLLLRQGLVEAWCGLGALAAALTALSWSAWPAGAIAQPDAGRLDGAAARQQTFAVWVLCVEYGLNALALVPHMVFLVDFVARGLGRGVAVGSFYWVLYGLGAIVGPLVTGHLADRWGFRPALRVAFVTQAAAIALPAVSSAPVALIVSTLVAGACTPGIVTLALGRIHEILAHPAGQRSAWAQATTSFAICQAAGAYGFSYLFTRTGGNYDILFTLGACAALAALAVDLVATKHVARRARRQRA